MCPDPGGVIHARRSGALFPYQEDDEIQYTCDPCFSGGGTITCQRGGQWSGSVVCAGNCLLAICCHFVEWAISGSDFKIICFCIFVLNKQLQ